MGLFLVLVIGCALGMAAGHFLYSPTWSLRPVAGLQKTKRFIDMVNESGNAGG